MFVAEIINFLMIFKIKIIRQTWHDSHEGDFANRQHKFKTCFLFFTKLFSDWFIIISKTSAIKFILDNQQ